MNQHTDDKPSPISSRKARQWFPEEARITSGPDVPVRLLGSRPFNRFLRRRPNDGPPKPDGNHPPQPVSVPDYAFQFSIPTASGPACLNDADLNKLLDALCDPRRFGPCDPSQSTPSSRSGPNVDIRSKCAAGVTSIGIWVRPTASVSDSDARNRGVDRLNLLQAGEIFGLFISSNTIVTGAIDAWNQQPKQYDALHLTGFDVSFESPNRIVTRIDGFDEDPTPDVDFQVTITDTLSASGGQVHCDEQSNVETDTSILGDLLAGILFALTPWVPELYDLTLRGLIFRLGSIFYTPPVPQAAGGVGCIVANNLPQQVMIPGGKKISFLYTRVAVNGVGLFCAGLATPGDRMPAIEIGGDNNVPAFTDEQGVASGQARSWIISLSDVLQPQINWTAQDGVVQTPSSPLTTVNFNLGPARVGTTVTRIVSIQVTDLDNGAVVSAQRDIRFNVMSGTEPPEPPKPPEPGNGP